MFLIKLKFCRMMTLFVETGNSYQNNQDIHQQRIRLPIHYMLLMHNPLSKQLIPINSTVNRSQNHPIILTLILQELSRLRVNHWMKQHCETFQNPFHIIDVPFNPVGFFLTNRFSFNLCCNILWLSCSPSTRCSSSFIPLSSANFKTIISLHN